ncbi:MAG: hypothetical protein IJP90_12010 [Treponema sp.]|nr:hypothetical protein [Treponema sp.]
MEIIYWTTFVAFVLTIGFSLLERVFGLKYENTIPSKILYFVYKVSFIITFFALWIFIFLPISYAIYESCKIIDNLNLRIYLTTVLILCLNLRGYNIAYFLIKISLYSRFKQHPLWLSKSNEIFLYVYRFIVYLAALGIVIVSNTLSFLDLQTQYVIILDNISVINTAFATVLGFDVFCDSGAKLFSYIKSLLNESK